MNPPPTTLTILQHGIRWRMRGIPIFDDDGETIIGRIDETIWQEADLAADQKAELEAEISLYREARPEDDPLWVRWAIMEHSGVNHEHRRGRWLNERRPALGFECSMCRGCIVNEDPGDFEFVGGPANGRWFVTNGATLYRVPVPQLIVATFKEGPLEPNPNLNIANYFRHGDRYYFEA